MNEAETRAEHIDPALKVAGWGVIEGSRILREYYRKRPAPEIALMNRHPHQGCAAKPAQAPARGALARASVLKRFG